MRKILLACAVAALAVALLAPWGQPVTGMPVPGPTPSSTPIAGLGGGQLAISDFFSPLPSGKGFSAYFVGVVRSADAASADFGADMFVAGETCHIIKVKTKKAKKPSKSKKEGKKEEDKHQRYTLECDGFEHEAEIPFTDFQMDPLLRSAHLNTQIEGKEIDITWTGQGELPEGGAGLGFYGDGIVDGGASAGRWASAEGTIFGHPVSSGDEQYCFSFSVMVEGAGGFADVRSLAEGFQVPRLASEISSEGVRALGCSSRTRTATA